MAEEDKATAKVPESTAEHSEIVFLGLDLGTSQSAVATSTSLKLNVASIVGWPKDFIAYNVVKKTIVFGEECVKYRTSLDVCYPLDKGVIKYRGKGSGSKPKNEREAGAAVELFKHLLGLVDKRGNQKLYTVIGAPARSSVEDKQAIINAAEGLVDAILVVSEPFLVAYNLGLYENTIVVDIGAGTLDICRMTGTVPGEEDQKTLYVAGNEIDNKFCELLKESHPEIFLNLPLARKIKEEYAFVGDGPEKIELEFNVGGSLTTIDVAGELREACSMIIPDICASIRELVLTYDPEFMSLLSRNIILAGGGSVIKGLAAAVQADLSEDFGTVIVTIADDPRFCGALGGLKLAQEMPLSEWEQL